MPVKVLLNGAKGRMGQAIIAAAPALDCEIVGACDLGDDIEPHIKNCDAAVDFSFRDATEPLAALCAKHGKPLVIGTTGHTPQQRENILKAASNIAVVWAGNYSIGVNLLNRLTEIAAKILDDSYDVEIVEMHHRMKKDAPSGTADKLKQIVCQARNVGEDSVCYGRKGLVGERPRGEIGVHALRGGSVVGDHTVVFAADGERLELTHKAADRKVFAQGALRAAKWIVGKSAGLYDMSDVLNFK